MPNRSMRYIIMAAFSILLSNIGGVGHRALFSSCERHTQLTKPLFRGFRLNVLPHSAQRIRFWKMCEPMCGPKYVVCLMRIACARLKVSSLIIAG